MEVKIMEKIKVKGKLYEIRSIQRNRTACAADRFRLYAAYKVER